MKLLLGSIFRVTVRYVYLRGKAYYYQRKIPKDLLHRYPGSIHVKINLKTSDPRQIAKKVGELNKQYEATWRSLRGNPDLKPLSVREAAQSYSHSTGCDPQPADNDENLYDQLIERLRAKEEAHAQGDPEVYYSAEPEDYLDPVEMEALRLLKEEPKGLCLLGLLLIKILRLLIRSE